MLSSSRLRSAPALLFQNGEPGVWFDPSDFSTLFQDSAGSTPVTALGQPVGKMLDKSGRGNHASQPTAASRPTIEARVNLFDKTAAMTDAAWPFAGGTKTGGYTGIRGTPTACVFKGPSSGTPSRAITATSTSMVYTLNVKWVSGLTSRGFLMRNNKTATNFDSLTLNVQTGAVVSGGIGWTITAGANGWFKLRYTRSTGISVGDGIQLYYGAAGTVPDSGEWAVDEPQLEAGLISTAYQQVNTASDYVDTGAPRYLRFDGTDDWLSTASVDLTSSDKLSLWAGVKKLSDATQGVLIEHGTTTASAGMWGAGAPGQSGSPNYSMSGCSTAGSSGINSKLATTFTAPVTNVVYGSIDYSGATSATEISMRVNGAIPSLATTGSSDNTGTLGNQALYLGRRAGTALALFGHIYGLIALARITSTAEIAQIERLLNSRARAY